MRARNTYVELPATGTILRVTDAGMWKEAKRLTKADGARRLKAQAVASLLESLAPGDTVYTVLRHVSRSGMYRVIDCYKATDNGMLYLSGLMLSAGIGEEPRGRRDGIGISGAGMDMGFELVYRLGRTLFPDGFKVEGRGRNGDTSGHDPDGGYAFKHRWL